ncbi:hypothetical protein KDA_35410 [Dictyobacter alpinus]|uniref:Uncharacterized protein n=1 Tax=Dictyobacter alpinus TaxID=2014873 RepID=A0A402B9Q8_9CHLR|nr:hypothetical protein KDA_35410 [Dictyobacter alpinus]
MYTVTCDAITIKFFFERVFVVHCYHEACSQPHAGPEGPMLQRFYVWCQKVFGEHFLTPHVKPLEVRGAKATISRA